MRYGIAVMKLQVSGSGANEIDRHLRGFIEKWMRMEPCFECT